MERGISVVECRTHNRERPGSNPPFATVSKFGHFHSLSCMNEYLAIYSDGNVNDWLRNCSVAESFPEKSSWCRNEQVCQGAKCKRFERPNGLDTALYKNIPLTVNRKS